MERDKAKFNYEIIKNNKDYYYANRGFEYTPPGWVEIENVLHPLGYKVVTLDLKSLGLRKNPTIIAYPLHEWILEPNNLIKSAEDSGGIWSGASLASARKTQKYCLDKEKNPFLTRVFYAAIYNPVFANDYRVKSQGLMVLEEIK